MASLHVVSKLWWLLVDYLLNLMVMFHEVCVGYLKFLDGKSTRGIQIVRVNSGLSGEFNWSWNGYLKFLDSKPTDGVQIMMVNSGLPGEFNGVF